MSVRCISDCIHLTTEDLARVREELDLLGYSILRGVISSELVAECRDLAVQYFHSLQLKHDTLPNALRGNVGAGMRDVEGFSETNRWYLYRSCFFPWNAHVHQVSLLIQLSRYVSSLRGSVLGKQESDGLTIGDDGAISYTSLSLYPVEGGFLERHRDAYSGTNLQKSLIHFKIELTQKGIDYQSGGLYVWDKKGKLIDISGQVRPTDIIFFDGFQPHEIKPIEGSGIGRIALFEIPTHVDASSRDWNYTTAKSGLKIRSKAKRMLSLFRKR